MKHNITANTYSDGGAVITENDFKAGKERLSEIGYNAKKVLTGEMSIEQVPFGQRAEVTQAVEIMKTPSLEGKETEEERTQRENAEMREALRILGVET